MVINLYDMDNNLKDYDATLRPVIKTVMSCDNFGISKHRIKVTPRDRTHVQLEIPYATRVLTWEVFFLADNLTFAPDFYFNDEFLEDPDPDVLESYVPTLSSWNVEDSDALLNVLKELLALYRHEQQRILASDLRLAKLYLEYKELLQSDNDVKNNSVEINIRGGIVNFLIAMNIDFSCLPPYCFPLVFSDIMDPGENFAFLHISIDANPNSRRGQSPAVLRLSPQVELALGGSATMSIPLLSMDTNMCQYVTQVHDLLKDKVATVADHYNRKMEFIQQMLSLTNVSIQEYDVVKHDQISILFGENDDVVQVTISMDAAFPRERPKVKVNSIYKEQNGKPKTINVQSYLYNPNLPAEAIINNIFAKLRETMKTFK